MAIAAAIPAVASAQVTVGGIMDGGWNKTITTTTPTSGADKKDERVQTGGNAAGALASNRLFFRGTEKVGDLTAGFHYELGLDAGGTGTLNAGVSGSARMSIVSLAGGFGEIRIGRDYTPIFSLSAALDTSQADNVNIGKSVYLNGAISITTVRNDGQIMYTLPTMGGLTLKAAVANRTSGPDANGDVEAYGGSAVYAAGPLMVGVAYNNQQSLGGTTTLTKTKREEWIAGGSYTVSPALSLQFQYGDLEQKAGIATTEYKGWQLGGRYNVTPTMMAHLSFGGGEHTLGDFAAAKFGLIYSVSKRTRVYWLSGADILEYKSGTTKERMRQELAIGLNHAF